MFIPIENSYKNKDYLEKPIIKIPRKTNISYFSLAALKKGGLLKWDDKFGRRFTYSNGDYIIQQIREENIVKNLQENLADIGITRQSYITEATGKWPDTGDKIDNLYIIEKLDFCPDVILPVTLVPPNKYEEKVIVQPNIKKTSKLLFDTGYENYYMISVPSGLKLGIGFFGLVRTAPFHENEFKGDMGEDGYPYERLRSYGVVATSNFEINGEEMEIKPIYDYPVLVKNEESDKDVEEYIKKISYGFRRLGNKVDTYEWVKENGTYASKEVSSKSVNKEVIDIIEQDMKDNYFVYNEGRGKCFSPNSFLAIFYKTDPANLEVPYIPKFAIRYKKINSFNSLKKVVSKAVKNNIEYILFLGEEEKNSNSVTIKDLKNKTQERINWDELKDKIYDSKPLENILLIQEKGVKNFERRLYTPGEKYKKTHQGDYVYGNYKDVPNLILDGYINKGIVGYDILLESLAKRLDISELPNINEFNDFAKRNRIPMKITPTGEGKCKLSLAKPTNLEEIKKNYNIDERVCLSTLVTEYPNLANLIFDNYKIIEVSGTTEVYPYMVLDIVGTGATLKRNNKEIVKDIFDSEVVVVERKEL